MSQVELAPEIGEDFDRILEHLHKFDVDTPSARIDEIISGISVLEHNPLIGRPLENDLRELVIGRGTHGYIALYRYLPELDTVFLLAIRNNAKPGIRDLDDLRPGKGSARSVARSGLSARYAELGRPDGGLPKISSTGVHNPRTELRTLMMGRATALPTGRRLTSRPVFLEQ